MFLETLRKRKMFYIFFLKIRVKNKKNIFLVGALVVPNLIYQVYVQGN